MISAITTWFMARLGGPALIGLGLAALVALGSWGTVTVISGWLADARQAGASAERRHWQASIEKSNREVAEARSQRAEAVAALEAGAGAEIATLRQQLTDLEVRNAALPDADRCGLGRDRVRLLPP